MLSPLFVLLLVIRHRDPAFGTDVLDRRRDLYFFRFQWKARSFPALIAAFQGERFIPLFAKILRHTGACSFVRSGAVSDNLPFGGKLAITVPDLPRVYPDRACDRPMHLRPDVWGDDVQDDCLAGFDARFGLGWVDSEFFLGHWLRCLPYYASRRDQPLRCCLRVRTVAALQADHLNLTQQLFSHHVALAARA
jgi:hypothetical protein